MGTAVSEPKTHTGRILVIDDDYDLAETLCEMLSFESYDVQVGHSVAEAFALTDAFEPQVALVDVKLGTENGLDLIARLRVHRPELLAIVVTAYANIDTAIDALKTGAYDFVRKPVHAEELFAVIKKCFEKLQLERDRKEAVEALRQAHANMASVNARLRRITESTRQLTSCSELVHFARQLLTEFAHNMAAEGGSIFLREGNQLVRIDTLGESGAPATIALPLPSNTVLGRLFETGQPVLIHNIESEGAPVSSGCLHYSNGSALAFPLRAVDKSELAGVITLHNKRFPPFTEQDCELGQILASFSYERLNSLRATESLLERERLYRLLADNITDVIWTLDAEFRFVYVSPSAKLLWGYEPAELVGRYVGQLIGPNSIETALQAENRLKSLNGEAPSGTVLVSVELEIIKHDGTPTFTETRVSLLADEVAGSSCYLGVARDITERRLAEKESRQRLQQLMQADKLVSLGTLVAGVAHEINNPNQVIMSAGSALRAIWKDLAALLREDSVRYATAQAGGMPMAEACTDMDEVLGMVADASERIRRIVHDLREFSRQDPGTLAEQVNVNEALDRALRLLASFVKRSTQHLERDYDPAVPLVQGNRQRLEQVFVNVIQNACQALDSEEKRVWVRTRFDAAAGRVVIEVEDEGGGIADEALPHIMDPFYTTKRDKGGTGLGLPVSNTIVKEHGGSIQVETELGKGSIFRISIPAI